jgi:hypothetical protein
MSLYERQTYAHGSFIVPDRFPSIFGIQLGSNPNGIRCAVVPERNLDNVKKEINLKNKL